MIVYNDDTKTGTADMIEGTEAFERFRDAAKKLLTTDALV